MVLAAKDLFCNRVVSFLKSDPTPLEIMPVCEGLLTSKSYCLGQLVHEPKPVPAAKDLSCSRVVSFFQI